MKIKITIFLAILSIICCKSSDKFAVKDTTTAAEIAENAKQKLQVEENRKEAQRIKELHESQIKK